MDARAFLLARDGPQCYLCGHVFREVGRHVTVDHVIPRSRGGTDDWENLRLACLTCNARKGAKLPHEYDAFLAFQRSFDPGWELRQLAYAATVLHRERVLEQLAAALEDLIRSRGGGSDA